MRSLLLLPVLALAASSFALGVGDKAPPLKVETVVKGNAVNLDKGIHVVEFWATWCGPCKTSIPHLTELAKKYKGKVDFTGVSVWEEGEDQLGQVKKFVAAMGPKMDYNVSFDGSTKTMSSTWMEAAKQGGIPTAFLVKDGQILWIGHPMGDLEGAIEKTVQGKYDVAAEKAKMEKEEAEAEAKQAAMKELMQPFVDAMQEGDIDGALKELDKIEAVKPEMKPMLAQTRFGIYMQTGNPKLLDLAKRFATEDFKDNASALNSFAWAIVDPASKVQKPNFEAALIMAKRAAEVSEMKEGSILDTYALALFKTGDKAKAIEVQTKAVELIKKEKDVDPATVKELEDRLAEFKKASA